MASPGSSAEPPRAPTGFELVGELGQDRGGAPVYLARESATDQLVALKLPGASAEATDRRPQIFRTLGPDVPAAARVCPICRVELTDWRPYCPRCGSDVSGKASGPAGPEAVAELVTQVEDPDAANLDVLGSMPREHGGAAVYFARRRTTGEIVALAVERAAASGGGPASLTVTSMRPAQPSGPVGASATGADAPPPDAEPDHAAPAAIRTCPTCSQEFGASVRFCPHDGSVLRPKDVSEELIGHTIAERYHILKKLGQGGMGQVYLAEHVKMGRRCALKVMHRVLSQVRDAHGGINRQSVVGCRSRRRTA